MARKKKSGEYFTETIELPRGPDGERRRKYIRSKTAVGLKEKIQAAYAALDAGDLPIKARDGMTLGAWLKLWLVQERKRAKLARSTLEEYARSIDKKITPKLGAIQVAHLTVKQVQRFVDDLDCGPRTARNIMSPLVRALDAAVVDELCRRNVAKLVRLPELQQPELYKLSPEQLQAFLAEVAGDRFEALYWLAMLGPRMGELLALHIVDIDLDAATVAIHAGVRRLPQDGGKSKMQEIDTKTANSRRILRLPPQWVAVLRAHLARLAVEQGTRGWKECGLLFPSSVGTIMQPPNLRRRSFKPALKRAALPEDAIRFHDLRHAAASMFIALGYDARTVADILGHSSPEFTLRQYAYAFEAVKERAIADVGALLNPTITLSPKVHEGS